MTRYHITAVTLDDDTKKKLRELSEHFKVSASGVVRMAIMKLYREVFRETGGKGDKEKEVSRDG